MPDYPRRNVERGHVSSVASDVSAGSRSLGASSPLRLSAHVAPVGAFSGGVKEPSVAHGAVHELEEFMPFAWPASQQRDFAAAVPLHQDPHVGGLITPRLTQFIPDIR